MGRANGQHKDRKDRRLLVRAVADVLATGDPTPFRWEAWCRHTLRGEMCLAGKSWPLSDATAADIIRRAMDLINVQRPPWAWGQREYTWDTVGTRIGFSHCLECGAVLPEGRLKFCGGGCGDRYRRAFQCEALQAHERERALAYLQACRDRAEPKECEACGRLFKPAKAQQRFCSRQCGGGRTVKEKMNGKHHPWMNGTKIGDGIVNGANGSSLTTPTPGNGTAAGHANNVTTPTSSKPSAPQSAPSSNATGATCPSGRTSDGKIGSSAARFTNGGPHTGEIPRSAEPGTGRPAGCERDAPRCGY